MSGVRASELWRFRLWAVQDCGVALLGRYPETPISLNEGIYRNLGNLRRPKPRVKRGREMSG